MRNPIRAMNSVVIVYRPVLVADCRHMRDDSTYTWLHRPICSCCIPCLGCWPYRTHRLALRRGAMTIRQPDCHNQRTLGLQHTHARCSSAGALHGSRGFPSYVGLVPHRVRSRARRFFDNACCNIRVPYAFVCSLLRHTFCCSLVLPLVVRYFS